VRRLKTALVLGGGGARGAYEAGVLSYLREELEPELQLPLHMDIICGTSVGAINACHLASHAATPALQGKLLCEQWRALRIDRVLSWGPTDLVRVLRDLLGRPSDSVPLRARGGLVNPAGLEQLVLRGTHWPSIGRNLRSGALEALAVSATHVASGHTMIFIQRRGGGVPDWTRDPHLRAVAANIGPRHALASAAIPLLFPAVRVNGQLFTDGGLRFDVPMSPAIRLGAERVAIISLRHLPTPEEEKKTAENHVEPAYGTAPFLIGKTLNAFLLDRTDQDVERLQRLNSMLTAGTKAFGSTFAKVLNEVLAPRRNSTVRYVRNLLMRPSQDIGKLAAEYTRSPEFRRSNKGLAGSTLRRLVEREASDSADLVSYLLFDSGFADLLISLGRADARERRDDWARFWSDVPEEEAEAAQMQSS
jgi:NTE family protein